MTLLALGPEGTFSDHVARRLAGEDEEVRLMPTIGGIFAAVEAGEGDGVVPIENSEAGGVGPTLDGLQQHQVAITGEAYLLIVHSLASTKPLHSGMIVYAHQQTHEQCSTFIEAEHLTVVQTSSNAASAVAMQEHPGTGAIVSPQLAALYHLPIVATGVQNSTSNTTRFVRIGRRDGGRVGLVAGAEKCSILVDPHENRAGLLYDLLGVFAARGITLSRIESRPSKRGIGTYVFFIDLVLSTGWEDAIRELKQMTSVKEFGCYPLLEVN
ncbi:prephenate dehydratase [Methanosphaerula palustris]|uniref:Prephenate dehydratase n=1 Tax=Methanosphaerula palustris (strain ATCC BAA-1556 / DSM 19958 / E1-9c) TaxID=521011 RepID=B8GF71_METPE|nr:prephenate dehydratase domain-containing protein [Methanosphaerula palustris]ACL17877.1 Prephenate dehydratase [Methanosphaerula palustris E1-9c]